MGKDNILFHSIICPATLKATNQHYNLPSKISATQYLMYQGGKFSKSQNIGVFGDDCEQTGLSSDYWRYYLLRMRPQSFDSEFSWEQFAAKCNKQLLNSIGNLIHRVLKYSYNNYGAAVLQLKQQDIGQNEQMLVRVLQQKYNKYGNQMEEAEIGHASTSMLEMSYEINGYIAKTEFWKSQR